MTQDTGLPNQDDVTGHTEAPDNEAKRAEAPALSPQSVSPANPQARKGGGGWAVLYVVSVVALAGAGYWAWQHPVAPAGEASNAALDALAARVAALEAKPAMSAAPVDLKPLQDRLTALENRPSGGAPAGLDELAARVARLEQAAPGVSGANPDSGAQAAVAALAARLDADEGKLTAPRDGATAASLAALADRVAALDSKLAQLDKSAAQLHGLSDEIGRQAKLQAAKSALENGLPLGPLDGAPPALARFAQAKPPTGAALKLAFPEAARAAEQSPEPGDAASGLAGRVLARAEGLVTVRQGDRVILGNAASVPVEQARQLLDAGDLAGAVAALEKLPGAPAPALAAWLDQAKSLLAARQALTAMMAAH